MLDGRRVVLAVTGGVAAYKSAIVARRLVEAGAEVRVILSDAALEFIGAQTFAAITGNNPSTSLFGEESVSPHTELGRWADAVVVAPTTAATMAKIVHGESSGIVPATLLATTAPVLLAPAMHTEMWENPATQRNLRALIEDGYHFIGPESGDLAGGDVGVGRVSEPDDIVARLDEILSPREDAPTVFITAGGTREPIDPVRYIGNRSSGKMGHALANAAARRGLRVTLVTSSDMPVVRDVEVVRVETAQEMADAVAELDGDIAILAAAVADFRPAAPVDTKLSRAEGADSVALEPTPDVLASVVAREKSPFVVGFAAETGGVERAVEKARRKKVDLLVYNDVTEAGSGFGTDTNRVVLIDRGGSLEHWEQMPKTEVAEKLIDRVLAETQTQG